MNMYILRSLPPKPARHFPIEKSGDSIVIDDGIRHGKAVLYESHVEFCRRKEELVLEVLDTAVTNWIWVEDYILSFTEGGRWGHGV